MSSRRPTRATARAAATEESQSDKTSKSQKKAPPRRGPKIEDTATTSDQAQKVTQKSPGKRTRGTQQVEEVIVQTKSEVLSPSPPRKNKKQVEENIVQTKLEVLSPSPPRKNKKQVAGTSPSDSLSAVEESVAPTTPSTRSRRKNAAENRQQEVITNTIPEPVTPGRRNQQRTTRKPAEKPVENVVANKEANSVAEKCPETIKDSGTLPSSETPPVNQDDNFNEEEIEEEVEGDTDAIIVLSSDEEASAAETMRKEKVKAKRNNREEKALDAMRRALAEAFRGTYQSLQEEMDLKASVTTIRTCFSRVIKMPNQPGPSDQFFSELYFRLNFIFENEHAETEQARLRVMKMICHTAIVIQRDTNNHRMLIKLIEYLVRHHMASSAIVRLHTVIMCGYLLQMGVSLVKKDVTGQQMTVLANGQYRNLYTILVARQKDKFLSVRLEVIRAVSYVQRCAIPADIPELVEKSPRDMLFRALDDRAWECRALAVKLFQVHKKRQDSKEDIKTLVQIAKYDKCSKVRIACLSRLGELRMKQLSEFALDVLTSALADSDPNVRTAGRTHLFQGWLLPCVEMVRDRRKAGLQKMTGAEADIEEETQGQSKHGLFSAFNSIIACVGDFCNDTQVEQNARDMMRCGFDLMRELCGFRVPDKGPYEPFLKMLLEDPIGPNPVNANNYRDVFLMEDRDDQLLAFTLWRAMIEYCCFENPSVRDKEACIQLLCPTLSVVVRMTSSIATSDSVSEPMSSKGEAEINDSEDLVERGLALKYFTVRQLLGVCRVLDRDPVGCIEWKNLLTHILGDPAIPKELCDDAVQDLVEHFYHNVPQDALNALCDITACMMHKNMEPNATMYDQTVRLALSETLTPATSLEEKKCDTSTMTACLKVVHAGLKTGIFNRITIVIENMNIQIIQPCLHPDYSSDVRAMAMECNGILCYHDRTYAKTSYPFLLTCFRQEEHKVKITVTKCITELAIRYGTDELNKWGLSAKGSRPEEQTSYADVELPGMFTRILESQPKTEEEKEMVACAYESLTKLLFIRQRESTKAVWIDAVTWILIRYYHHTSYAIPRLRQCFFFFMPCFARKSRENQLMLVHVFFYFMSIMRDDQRLQKSVGKKVEIERATMLLASLTDINVLAPTARRKADGGSVQYMFLNHIQKYLMDNLDDVYLMHYCKVVELCQLHSQSLQLKRDHSRVQGEIFDQTESRVKPVFGFIDPAETTDTSSSLTRPGLLRKTSWCSETDDRSFRGFCCGWRQVAEVLNEDNTPRDKIEDLLDSYERILDALRQEDDLNNQVQPSVVAIKRLVARLTIAQKQIEEQEAQGEMLNDDIETMSIAASSVITDDMETLMKQPTKKRGRILGTVVKKRLDMQTLMESPEEGPDQDDDYEERAVRANPLRTTRKPISRNVFEGL